MNFDLYLGGPEQPRRRLRDILAEHVAAVPAGGEIDWVTYYFRDRQLAQALLDANRRGVRVRLTLEGAPRTRHANDRVLGMLDGPGGLGEGKGEGEGEGEEATMNPINGEGNSGRDTGKESLLENMVEQQ